MIMTNNRIETPSIGEILQEEFMIPMGLRQKKDYGGYLTKIGEAVWCIGRVFSGYAE